MRRQTGLRRRLASSFALFGACLAVLYGTLVVVVFHQSEDGVQERILHRELLHLLERGGAAGAAEPVSRFVTAYRGIEAVPEPLRARLAPLEPGLHELREGFPGGRTWGDYHVEVTDLGAGRRLYLVLDSSELEAGAQRELGLLKAVGTGFVIVLAVGIGTGRAVAGSVVRPVEELAELARSVPPEELGDRIRSERYAGEVGLLARTLREALLRVRAFVERERQFTANASHELRSPVAVIKGAAELLGAHPGSSEPAIRRPLERILRATTNLEETISVFLLLAREESIRPSPGGCPLRTAAEQAVEAHQRLLEGKPVEVEIRVAADIRIDAPEQVLLIVLGNLVSNAFQRIASGRVTIDGDEAGVAVRDTGPGIPPDLVGKVLERHARGPTSAGHGLGLSIVRTLCDRCGWDLEIASVEGEGTRATLLFRPARGAV